MLWIITKDLIDTGNASTLHAGSAKRRQEWDRTPIIDRPALRQRWVEQCNFEFRLYDDDGELYYEGVCLDLDQQDGDHAFAPLDWATCEAGCTRMDYRKKGERQWQTL